MPPDTEPLRPYEGERPSEPLGGSPHISDYWHVVSRRLWLVLVIFTITTGAAIWAVSQQRTIYESQLSLRVNDPLRPARGLVASGARVSGMDIYVDPIESEIQVLRSKQVGRAVVEELGLRLTPVDDGVVRSQLALDIAVAEDAPNTSLQLVYDGAGRSAALRTADGSTLGTAAVGGTLDGGMVRFRLPPPPDETRQYGLQIVPTDQVLGEVTDGLTAQPMANTNIIEVFYLSSDPQLAPLVLNAAARELREIGARRVVQQAEVELSFIEEQLDSVRQQREAVDQRIQRFKESQDFGNLSEQERELLNRFQEVNTQLEALDEQRAVLSDLRRRLAEGEAAEIDFAPVLTVLPEDAGPQIRSLVQEIRDGQAELRSLLAEEQLARAHPRVRAELAEIDEIAGDLLEAVDARLAVIGRRLDQLTEEAAELRGRQSRFPDLQSRLEQMEQQKEMVDETHQFLLSQLFQADIVRGSVTPYVEVIDPAVGVRPLQPRGKVNVFLGALLGLILGVGAAFFLEYLDRTVRTSSDVESLLGIPVLGVIPRLRRLGDGGGDRASPGGKPLPMVVALDPVDPAAEAYRNLRMNLMFMSTEEDPIRTVLFSSPGPDEGKSTTALNFAVMLAQRGERVLLLDADLRRPALHRSLDLLREPGLTNLLVGDVEAREAIRPNVLPNLDVLPSGPFPPNPSELLSSGAMIRLLEEFEERYAHVIVDSPPVLAVTDSAILADHTDGVVLVLRSGETEQRAAERSVEQLRRLDVRIFGAVLNEVYTGAGDESYYLRYQYGYHPTKSGWDRIREGIGKARFW